MSNLSIDKMRPTTIQSSPRKYWQQKHINFVCVAHTSYAPTSIRIQPKIARTGWNVSTERPRTQHTHTNDGGKSMCTLSLCDMILWQESSPPRILSEFVGVQWQRWESSVVDVDRTTTNDNKSWFHSNAQDSMDSTTNSKRTNPFD